VSPAAWRTENLGWRRTSPSRGAARVPPPPCICTANTGHGRQKATGAGTSSRQRTAHTGTATRWVSRARPGNRRPSPAPPPRWRCASRRLSPPHREKWQLPLWDHSRPYGPPWADPLWGSHSETSAWYPNTRLVRYPSARVSKPVTNPCHPPRERVPGGVQAHVLQWRSPGGRLPPQPAPPPDVPPYARALLCTLSGSPSLAHS